MSLNLVNPADPSAVSGIGPVASGEEYAAALESQKNITNTATGEEGTAAETAVQEQKTVSKSATQKSGGTVPSSTQNQGLSKKDVIKSAAAEGGPQKTFKIELIEGYANLIKATAPSVIKQADWYRTGRPSENPDIEGPYKLLPRMIQPFDNEETDTASIRVVNTKNEDLVPPYSKFILESATEGHSERSQIVETFGDFYVFLYGERPPLYSYAGTLINTKNANWVSDFSYYYENYLRGTKCVENQARLILTYAGAQVEGFMLNASWNKQAATLEGVRFNFQMVITSKKYLGLSDDFASYVQGDKTLTDEKTKEILDAIAGKSGTGSSDEESSEAMGILDAGIGGGPLSGVGSFV